MRENRSNYVGKCRVASFFCPQKNEEKSLLKKMADFLGQTENPFSHISDRNVSIRTATLYGIFLFSPHD
jgi:hypothetical protein